MTLVSSVTPTTVSGVYRVSFLLRDTERQREEVVCFVRADETGKLEINYSHTNHHARETTIGPWKDSVKTRVPINPILEALIRSHVSLLLTDYFFGKVRVLPGEIGASIETVKW